MTTPAVDGTTKTDELVEQITKAIQAIPGMAEVELAGAGQYADDDQHNPTWATWGALYNGVPQSFSWNITS